MLGSKAIAGGSNEKLQVTTGGVRSVIFLTHSPGVFPSCFNLWGIEMVLIALFSHFNM